MTYLIFILAVYGLTLLLVEAKIFAPLRSSLAKGLEAKNLLPLHYYGLKFLNEIFTCHVCMAFWVGLFLCFLSRWTVHLPTLTSAPDYLVLSVMGCGTTWLLHCLDAYLYPN